MSHNIRIMTIGEKKNRYTFTKESSTYRNDIRNSHTKMRNKESYSTHCYTIKCIFKTAHKKYSNAKRKRRQITIQSMQTRSHTHTHENEVTYLEICPYETINSKSGTTTHECIQFIKQEAIKPNPTIHRHTAQCSLQMYAFL